MEGTERGKGKAWMPLLFSLILILGMVLGFNLRDSLRGKRDINTVVERNDRLEQVIDLINEKYVDSINGDHLYKDAISGILKSLDPHTVYIPAEDMQDINDDMEGGFSGIGVEFSIVRDTIEVTSVIDKGPASQVGIELGDQLIKVGDSVVAGVNITSSRIINMLKGKQKSNVSLTIKHFFSPALKQVSITRDLIPLYSVDAGIMLDRFTGMIKINRFSATTHKEFADALKRLKNDGAKQLIIDLRDNPGGYLDQATQIADELIDGNKLIVYTQGTHAAKTEYTANLKGLFEKGKVIILMDESSASASEILAGAVQDWDRGLIVGRRSFGKGLVQEPYEMGDGSELRLTVAKYYTPSGRSIQRSFAKGRAAYQADYEKRFESGELTGKDLFVLVDTTKYYTANHRVVYSGGGIKPDVYVPYDTMHISADMRNRIASAGLKTAIWDYFLTHRSKLKYRNIQTFLNSFDDEDKIIDGYLASVNPLIRRKVGKELSRPANRKYFQTHIRAQIARFLFKDNGYYAVLAEDDNVINRALELLDEGEYSDIISGKSE
ncbi:carboxyl-terminal protease [Flavipsychrobacter stenotrophus]|uniref:Carboxyl-terminal protease n=2 Tax=Flavipsychrobacter stenotrophus TaxID=2077091 RepID=A0A2S7SQV4_9BACT|nr:carboxyl-terminal protease [Flavipsychrobacter stenotrophus]